MLKKAGEERITGGDVAVFSRWRRGGRVKGKDKLIFQVLANANAWTLCFPGQTGKSWGIRGTRTGRGLPEGVLVEWVTSQPPDGLPNVSVQAPTPSSLWQKTWGFSSENGVKRVHQVPSSTMKAKKETPTEANPSEILKSKFAREKILIGYAWLGFPMVQDFLTIFLNAKIMESFVQNSIGK